MRPTTNPARGAAAVAALSACSGVLVPAGRTAGATSGCLVDHEVDQREAGSTARLAVRNSGGPITGGWTLDWEFPDTPVLTGGWGATCTQSGRWVRARDPEWTRDIAHGASVRLGFQASHSGADTAPAEFRLNGAPCASGTAPTPPSAGAVTRNRTSTATSPTRSTPDRVARVTAPGGGPAPGAAPRRSRCWSTTPTQPSEEMD
ncbi:cellulose binding domain-containing protein [Saccharothrix coeruleofusca]|uniref:CBM2 domain-containing protein n=1 Tax=Saccharothrix coeruleofusca TaxID=33919 RepID=A0A918AUK3_9PSEU|nr:cellulose binding domain-containing protein [Saccharothrix coeruleofusca]MBP2337054.1 hypothetical protein [Saccharothrix coeruleofusca]GGP86737.1 hypothetical protein GCM10010185_70680 [Saccharothrix coeruleofusca]